MKNEELRIGIASQSSTLAGEAEIFMTNHKAIGKRRENINENRKFKFTNKRNLHQTTPE